MSTIDNDDARRGSICRLAILTNGTLPLVGGAEQTCWDRAIALSRLPGGPEVLLLGPDLSPVAERYPDRLRYVGRINPRLTVETYPSRAFPVYPDNRQPLRGAGTAAIERALSAFRPDLLTVVEPEGLTLLNGRRVPGVTWARRAGLPVVFENHTQFAVLARDYLGEWARLTAEPMLRAMYAFADAVICFSEWNAGQLAELGVGPVHRLAFPAVDLSRFSPAHRTRPRYAGSAAGHVLRVAYVGRFAEEKRLSVLIEAVGHLRSSGRGAAVELRLVGAGPHGPMLAEDCRRVGLDPAAVMVGVRRGADLAREYADADAMVNPCPVETFGLAALEALASGTPAVVPAAGGMAGFVTDGLDGRVVADLNAERLAAVLGELADAPTRLAEMSSRGPRTAARFSPEAVVAEQWAVLNAVAERHRWRRGRRSGL
jgi:alpha-1,6-mannosyltransferase